MGGGVLWILSGMYEIPYLEVFAFWHFVAIFAFGKFIAYDFKSLLLLMDSFDEDDLTRAAYFETFMSMGMSVVFLALMSIIYLISII